MNQDSIDTNINNTETYSPLFLMPKSDSSDSNDIGFNKYVTRVLNENTPPTKERKSIFKEKTLIPNKNLRIDSRKDSNEDFDWIFCLIILIAAVYLILIKAYPKRIKQIIYGCLSNRAMNNMLREGSLISEIILLPVIFVFVPTIALLGFGFINEYNLFNYLPIKSHFAIFGISCAIVAIICSLKIILVNFFGLIFKCKDITSQYNNNQIAFYVVNGLFLAPLMFFYFYSPENIQEGLLITTCILLGISYLIRLLRGFVLVLSSSKFSKVYLFFYLCIVEIVPLLIIYKLLA